MEEQKLEKIDGFFNEDPGTIKVPIAGGKELIIRRSVVVLSENPTKEVESTACLPNFEILAQKTPDELACLQLTHVLFDGPRGVGVLFFGGCLSDGQSSDLSPYMNGLLNRVALPRRITAVEIGIDKDELLN